MALPKLKPAPGPPSFEPYSPPKPTNMQPTAANENIPGKGKPPDNLPKQNTWGKILARIAGRVATRSPVVAAGAAGAVGASALAVQGMPGRLSGPLHQSLGLPGQPTRYTFLTGQPLRPQLSLTDPPPAPATSEQTNVKVREKTMAEKKKEGMDIIEKGDFDPKSAGGKPPALWMGGAAAEAEAHRRGYSTLGDTPGGKALNNHVNDNKIPWENSKQLFEKGSEKYAEKVADYYGKGNDAPAVIGRENPGSILRTTEQPTLGRRGVGLNEIWF